MVMGTARSNPRRQPTGARVSASQLQGDHDVNVRVLRLWRLRHKDALEVERTTLGASRGARLEFSEPGVNVRLGKLLRGV